MVLFHSISGALRAERLLMAEGLPLKCVPVPRHLSSDCGICVRIDRADEVKAEAILRRGNLEHQGVHPMEPEGP